MSSFSPAGAQLGEDEDVLFPLSDELLASEKQ